MTQRHKTYFGIGGIFVISGAIFAVARPEGLLQLLAGLPLVGSLFGLLVQILRDQAAHERAMLIQDAQNQFVLGASSHMANIAFDKHVAFSEAYVEEAQKSLCTLLRLGPTDEEVLKHTRNLCNIRNQFIVWLTDDVEAGIEPFETALRSIGANAGYVKAIDGETKEGEERQKALTSMYNTFAKIMAFPEWQGEKLTDELAIKTLVKKLRRVLGTEELTKMRGALVAKAVGGLQPQAQQQAVPHDGPRAAHSARA